MTGQPDADFLDAGVVGFAKALAVERSLIDHTIMPFI
jgi:hypothetical protein